MKALIIALSLIMVNIAAAEASKREDIIEPYAVSARMIVPELEPEIAPVGLQYHHPEFEIVVRDGGRYWNVVIGEPASAVSREQYIHEAIDEMIEREFPWLSNDRLLHRYPFMGIRNDITQHRKPISTDTIVDKSFKDLVSGRDSNLAIIGV